MVAPSCQGNFYKCWSYRQLGAGKRCLALDQVIFYNAGTFVNFKVNLKIILEKGLNNMFVSLGMGSDSR